MRRQLPLRRCGAITILLFMLLATSGCSTVKVAYNLLDWAVEWQLQRLVSLQEAQKLQTRQAIKEFHQWHRITQLPLYADYLQHLQQRLAQVPVTAADLHAETDKVQLLMEESLGKAIPGIATFLGGLDDEQVQELMDSIVEEREEYQEDYVDIPAAKRTKKLYKDFVDSFDYWTGPLTSQQKKQIQSWSESMEPYEALNLVQQEIWEADLARLLANRRDQQALVDGLNALKVTQTDNWQPELEQIMDRNQERTFALLAELLNNLSERQRAHLLNKLGDYRQAFLELAEEKT